MMKTVFVALALVGLSFACTTNSPTTSSGSASRPGPYCPGELIFSEEFNTLNTNIWNPAVTMAGGGNWEFQLYDTFSENSYIENGNLVLNPTLMADRHGEGFLWSGTIDLGARCTDGQWWGCLRTGTGTNILPPAISARFDTRNRFSFKYGRIEINAKIPAGDWIWPAIWMMPNNDHYGGWPRSGEIDIMEARSNRALFNGATNIGAEQVGSTLHFGPITEHNGWPTAHGTRNLPGSLWSNAYHRYQLEWSPDRLVFMVDDQSISHVEVGSGFWDRGNFAGSGHANPWVNGGRDAPFDQEFFPILNVAIGGTAFFPDGAVNHNGAKPWLNTSPNAATDFWNGRNQWLSSWNIGVNDDRMMKVDYVRVYAY